MYTERELEIKGVIDFLENANPEEISNYMLNEGMISVIINLLSSQVFDNVKKLNKEDMVKEIMKSMKDQNKIDGNYDQYHSDKYQEAMEDYHY